MAIQSKRKSMKKASVKKGGKSHSRTQKKKGGFTHSAKSCPELKDSFNMENDKEELKKLFVCIIKTHEVFNTVYIPRIKKLPKLLDWKVEVIETYIEALNLVKDGASHNHKTDIILRVLKNQNTELENAKESKLRIQAQKNQAQQKLDRQNQAQKNQAQQKLDRQKANRPIFRSTNRPATPTPTEAPTEKEDPAECDSDDDDCEKETKESEAIEQVDPNIEAKLARQAKCIEDYENHKDDEKMETCMNPLQRQGGKSKKRSRKSKK
jgi:hypothetical protein